MNTCKYCNQPIVSVIAHDGTYVVYSPDHRGNWIALVDNRFVGRFETQSDAVDACTASILKAKKAKADYESGQVARQN